MERVRLNRGKFYVYEHVRPDTGEVFYVGKGKGNRAFYFERKDNWRYWDIIKLLRKNDLVVLVKMIKEHLMEEEAFLLERELIAELGRADLGAGVLVNRTDGGEGIAGWKHAADFGPKIANYNRLYQANGGYTKGRKLSPMHRASLRAAWARRTPEQLEAWSKHVSELMRGNAHTKGKPQPKLKGRIISEEQRAKISAALKGRKPSLETRAKLSAAKKGVPKSPEHRAALAVHLRALAKTPEARARLVARNKKYTLKGVPKSPEHREKIGAAQRGKPKKQHQQEAAHA